MSNSLFAVRPKLLPNESLWSYVFRVADENGISLLRLLNSVRIWKKKDAQRADFGLLDISPTSVVSIEQLSNLTGHSEDILLNATFAPLLRVFSVSEQVQRARFLSGMVLDTYRFCPYCLKEELYFRLLWKLSPIISCAEHGVDLIDKCPNCDKQINLQNIEKLNICPHCDYSLTKIKVSPAANDTDREKQRWMYDALYVLLDTRQDHIKPSDLASRLLYLLCHKQPVFNRQLAEKTIPIKLPTLLQHARDSLAQKRTLHLSFLLNTLYELNTPMNEFLQVAVPDTFVDSLKQGVTRTVDQMRCQAPWCIGIHHPGTLVKTGSSVKYRKSGGTLLYYMACTECGCEYAIDESGQLKERTYFIEGYYALCEAEVPMISIKHLARAIGFTEDKTRRCLAYFSTRLEQDEWRGVRIDVEANLLKRVISNICNGKSIKVIQQWECWESYLLFLTYRFHPDVIRALIELKRPRPSNRSDSAIKREKVSEVLETLLINDEDITIGSVCQIVGVCPETLRYWGCNEDIAQAKQLQRQRRLELLKNSLYEKTDEYLDRNRFRTVSANELYKYLGIGRTIVWRIAPEVSAYISDRIRAYITRAQG